MKKVVSVLLCATIAFMLGGCGNDTDNTETQKKIEDAGWEIKLQKDAGTKVDYLTVTIDEDHSLDLTRYKDDDSIKEVGFNFDTPISTYHIGYDIDDGKDYTMYISDTNDQKNMYCVLYNLTDDEENPEYGDSGKCSDDYLDTFMSVQKDRDKTLSENNLSLNELYEWAVWYDNN